MARSGRKRKWAAMKILCEPLLFRSFLHDVANANVDDDAMICLSVALESKKETADPTATHTQARSIRLMCFAKRVPLTHFRFHVKTFVRIAKQQVRVFR